MTTRVRWLALVTGALALRALAQDAEPAVAPPLTPLEAAGEAARNLDYEQALKLLTEAATGAAPDLAARIKQRQVLYERLLTLAPLVEYARANPGTIVGLAITRDGQHLQGRLQVLELGVTAGAGIGTRRLDGGALALRLSPEATRTIPGREIAQLSITWLAPDAPGSPGYWTIQKIRAVLQTGEVAEGEPTWLMPLCSLSVRVADAAEDTDVVAFAGMDSQGGVGNLVTELVLLGGPPVGPEAPAPITATTPSGPVSGHPEITP